MSVTAKGKLRQWRFARAASLAAAVLMAALSPAAAQLTLDQIRTAPDSQVKFSAMLQFERTRYFSALVFARGCDLKFGKRIADDQRAFRSASARLQKVFAQGFDPDEPFDPNSIAAGPCLEPSIGSFEMKINELRTWADRAEQLTNSTVP